MVAPLTNRVRHDTNTALCLIPLGRKGLLQTPRPGSSAQPSEAGQSAPAQRERWLDAAESCYTRFGPAKTTVEDVAQAAGVSRATLYRHFKTRDQLLLAVIVREAGRLAAEAEIQLRRFDDVGSWIVEGMLFCLRRDPPPPGPRDAARAGRGGPDQPPRC